MTKKIAVLGAGAFGSALASTSVRAGHEVMLWGRNQAQIDAINQTQRNVDYLGEIALESAIVASTNLENVLSGADCIISAIPAQSTRQVLQTIAPLISKNCPLAPLVLSAKGIERSSGQCLSAIVGELLPNIKVGVLSGPSFATDIAQNLPTAVTIAAHDIALADHLASLLSTQFFRLYSTDDVTGVELGGALKNVLAISAGALTGAGLGPSAQAAMVTRGFVELRRIGEAFGARSETLMGLSGLGDLMLTCNSPKSRNYAYGMAIGRAENLEHRPLAEGAATAPIAAKLALDKNIDAPILCVTAALIGGEINLQQAIIQLLNRPLKRENI